MAQYNLVNNGLVKTLTTSGTGNKTLSWSEYVLLHDGVTSVSGINLDYSDVLYLEVDLSRRIKVDEVRLYLENMSALDKVNFYYKNTSSDSYTICTKSTAGTYYTASMTDPSAPQYILVTVSGVSCDLYELEVLNDDYVIAFGEDGDQSSLSLGAVPTGEESEVFTAYVYNNSSNQMPADAYAVIDYTDTDADKYLKLASTSNGTYYSIYDGINITDNFRTSDYYWDLGTFDNVSVQTETALKISSISTAYIGKFTTLPLQGYTNIFGVNSKPWHYDQYNKLLYVATSETNSSSAVKVYVYDFDANTWTYVCTIPNTGSYYTSLAVTITLHGKYLYFTVGVDETQDFWGRHDLEGAYDNWEWLTDPGNLNGDNWSSSYSATCSGGNYIYLISPYNNFFGRYNVNTDSWAALDHGFSQSNTGSPFRLSLVYDDVRNCLYLDTGANGVNDYVQKYYISSNTWDPTYLNYIARIGNNNIYTAMDYYNDKIYLNDPSYGEDVYIYDIATDSFSSKEIGFVRDFDDPSRMLVIPPLDTDDSFSLIMCNISGDNYGLYGYNIPNATENIEYTSGTYTTPIIDLGSKYNASYVLVDGATTSGLSTISYNEGVYDGTIRIRGSNTAPQPEVFIFWPRYYSSYVRLDKYNVVTDSTSVLTVYNIVTYPTKSTANIRKGRIFISTDNTSSTANNNCFVSSESGALNYLQGDYWADSANNHFDLAGFTKGHNIWAYSDQYQHLQLIRYNLDGTLIVDKSLPGLSDMTIEEDGEGVWYIDSGLNRLIHLDSSGTSICSIILTSPNKLCSQNENGCWVSDSSDLFIKKYSYYGDVLESTSITYAVSLMSSDFNGGLFYINTINELRHVDSYGNDLLLTDGMEYVTYMEACPYGCLLHLSDYNQVKYFDLNSGQILREYAPLGSYYSGHTSSKPCLLYRDLDTAIRDYDDQGSVKIPTSYDPTWSTLEWKEVDKDGYILDKYRYYQIEVTLQSKTASDNAYVYNITIPPVVRLQDIHPGQSKPFYLKTDIPEGTDSSDFTGKIKCWWSS